MLSHLSVVLRLPVNNLEISMYPQVQRYNVSELAVANLKTISCLTGPYT